MHRSHEPRRAMVAHPVRQRRYAGAVVALAIGLGAAGGARAQGAPDGGALLRELQRRAPADTPPSGGAVLPMPARGTPRPKDVDDVRIIVREFIVEGAVAVPEADVQAVLAPWRGRPIGFDDLGDAALAVSELYASRGRLVRPVWPAQDVADGRVTLRLVEGRLGTIRLDPAAPPTRLDPPLALARTGARQRPGEALDLNRLDRATRLLNELPGVRADLVMTPGREEGETDVLLGLQDRPLVNLRAGLDNDGARSTGATRADVLVQVDNPLGRGEQLAMRTVQGRGSHYVRGEFTQPVGLDGWQVGVSASSLRYRLLRDFSALDARGGAAVAGLSVQFPWVRAAGHRRDVAAAVETAWMHHDALGSTTSKKASRVLRLTWGEQFDDAAGSTRASTQASVGRLDVAGDGADAAPAEGRFARWSAGVSRLQRLGAATDLWLSVQAQRASRRLDSSERFSLGGSAGVRAYPSLEGAGDDGWITTAELRHQLRPDLQAAVFFDAGGVAPRGGDDPAAPRTTLRGAGLALQAQLAAGLQAHATVAQPIGRGPAAAADGRNTDGSRRGPRLWLGATFTW